MRFDGFLLVDKPAGMTSHDVVAKVRRKLKQKQVGHAGTLDPMATGLLVILLGDATKLSQFILDGDKRYVVEIEFGISSPTFDLDHDQVERQSVQMDPEKILESLNRCVGDFEWPAPMYSAVKVNGKKLYEYARSGEPVERPLKRMCFYDLEVVEQVENKISFSVSCSKGSFIRSIAEQMNEHTGVPAVVTKLSRLESDPYQLSDAIELEKVDPNNLPSCPSFVAMPETLQHWPSLKVTGRNFTLLRNGQISKELNQQLITKFALKDCDQVKLLSEEGAKLVALAELEKGRGFCLRKVFV